MSITNEAVQPSLPRPPPMRFAASGAGRAAWCRNGGYIPIARGFCYLVAIVDWFTRRVLSWRPSIRMDTAFCIEALEEALARYGKPEIFNSDQGSQFTSIEFTKILLDQKIQISTDGKGAWRDDVFVERLWGTVKYNEVYLHAYESVNRTPDEAYFTLMTLPEAA